jgi:asparagine synthase (glutamine-hydrolysing)
MPLDGVQPFERWDDLDVHMPEPVDDAFFATRVDQFRMFSADCRAVLSGEGADNLMNFEMWPYAKDMLRNHEWVTLVSENLRYLRARRSIWLGVKRRIWHLVGSDPNALIYPRWLAPDFARRLSLQERARERSVLPALRPHPVHPKAHVSLSLPQWAWMFEQEAPGLTHHPVEVRYPFLDLRIVNFLLALPPFPLFFEKKLLREAMAGRLPEHVRTRRKSPLAGNPLVAHLRRRQTHWTDQRTWSEEIGSYINKSALPVFGSDMNPAKLETDIRPLCLNFWLQSQRRVRYNLPAEVRNA